MQPEAARALLLGSITSLPDCFCSVTGMHAADHLAAALMHQQPGVLVMKEPSSAARWPEQLTIAGRVPESMVAT